MKSLDLKISSTLPVVKGNFDEIKKELALQLKKFDLVVEAEDIAVAKKMATAINKLSGQIDTLRKNEVKKLSAPIKSFESEAKELVSLCQNSRQNLLKQVKVFEDKERSRAKELLDSELKATYAKYGVRAEFQTIKIEDLTILSNLNKSGLAKKAITAIDERVIEAKQFQEKIDTRLLTLEAICFKGGLKAPLTRENINHFLLEKDDSVYLDKLTSMIKNELDRFEKMRVREEAKKVVPPTQKSAQQVVQVQKSTTASSKYPNFKNNVFYKKSTKRSYTVTATFEVEIEEAYAGRLEKMLLQKFAKSGFKTTPTVHVEEVRNVG